MRWVLDFLGQTCRGDRGRVGGDHFLDKIHRGEATFTELPQDLESVLVDPYIASPICSVVECIQPRNCAAHFLLRPSAITELLLALVLS